MGCGESDKHLSALDELKKSLLQQTFCAADRLLQAHPSLRHSLPAHPHPQAGSPGADRRGSLWSQWPSTAPKAAPSAAKDSSLAEHLRQHQMMPILIQALDGAMRTTVTLDDELLARAEKLCGDLERSALLKEALRALVQRESARRLAALGGSEPTLKPIPRRQAAP